MAQHSQWNTKEHLLVSVTSMSALLPQTPPSPNGRSHLLEALFYLRPLSYFYMGAIPSLEWWSQPIMSYLLKENNRSISQSEFYTKALLIKNQGCKMLTTYVVNRMHHITVCFLSLLCFKFGTNRLREALTDLKRPVAHRSHTLYWLPSCSDQVTVKSFLWVHIYAYLSS